MKQSHDKPLDTLVLDFASREAEYRSTLRQLLDWVRDKENHLLATQARMGNTRSYITSTSLKWIAANVYYAKDLPIFKDQRIPGTDRIEINEQTRQDIQQREPDYSRQLPMSVYLAIRRHHKFGPLILVAYKSWVYDDTSEMWDAAGRALESSLSLRNLDTKAALVDLDVANTRYFALDGQHRLMAIKGLQHLLDGRLEGKRKDGTWRRGKAITREQIEEKRREMNLPVDDLQSLPDENMGIEILPAVQEGETYDEAVSRLRSIFVDVNENARRLEKGELTLLDVNDGFRIVARIVLTTNKLFQPVHERVNLKTSNVSERSQNYTTLAHIVEMAREYLYPKKRFLLWSHPLFDSSDFGYLRPPADELDDGVAAIGEYFDALATIPSHRAIVEGSKVETWRSRTENDNVLFWPIAQVALARAIGDLQAERGKTLVSIVAMLAKYEGREQLRLTDAKAPWFGVLCDPIQKKIRRNLQYQHLCTKMFTYLLGGGYESDDQRDELRREFFQARRAGEELGEEVRSYDMSGSLVTYEKFTLPDPWQ